MKKLLGFAMLFSLAGCYTPMNNSGVATTKAWLEIPAVRTDFSGKQYDACYQFNLSFLPESAAKAIDLQDACVTACCWRSENPKVEIDFNENFERDLKLYGRARRYDPARLTLSLSHSNLLNTSNVSVSPKGIINRNGTVKLTYKEVEDSVRLRELAQQKQQRAEQYAQHEAQRQIQQEQYLVEEQRKYKLEMASSILQRQKSVPIDQYFYQMEKNYKQKDTLFLLGRRIYTTKAAGQNDLFVVSCSAPIQTGPSLDNLSPRTVNCGNWSVNTDTLTVYPLNNRARQIDK